MTDTEILLVLIGGIFVIEALSVRSRSSGSRCSTSAFS